jgi:hypothetical protein
VSRHAWTAFAAVSVPWGFPYLFIKIGETPGPGAIAGLALILAGCWLATDGRLPRPLRRATD